MMHEKHMMKMQSLMNEMQKVMDEMMEGYKGKEKHEPKHDKKDMLTMMPEKD